MTVASGLTTGLSYAFGIAYGLALAHLLLRRIQDRIWLRVLSHNELPASLLTLDFRVLPGVLGAIERSLYVASVLMNHLEFIGIWLAIKVAGGWKGWSEGRAYPGHKDPATGEARRIPGAQVFNAHLIGAGLSVLFGVTAALSIRWLLKAKVVPTLWMDGLLVAACLALIRWARPAPPANSEASKAPHAAASAVGALLVVSAVALALLLRRGRAA